MRSKCALLKDSLAVGSQGSGKSRFAGVSGTGGVSIRHAAGMPEAGSLRADEEGTPKPLRQTGSIL